MHFFKAINFFVCHLKKTACGHFVKKNRLGDHRVIITSIATNQRRDFSIITYVIRLLMTNYSTIMPFYQFGQENAQNVRQ